MGNHMGNDKLDIRKAIGKDYCAGFGTPASETTDA